MRRHTSVSCIVSHHNGKRQSTRCDDNKMTTTLFALWQWRDPQGKPPMHLYCVARRQRQQQWQWWWRMSTTRPWAQTPGIFISCCSAGQRQQLLATTNNECRTTRPCVRAHNIFLSVARWQWQQCQAHIISIKHRCNNQPGNVKLRRAQAIS